MRPLLVLLAVAAPAGAQDIASGPDKGAAVPALSVYDATGIHKEKTVDYAAERKDKPTIYLLIAAAKFDRPMNRFMKSLDMLLANDFKDVYVVAVWLTEDLDKTKEYLPRIQQSVQYTTTALTCTKEATGPKGWNANTAAHITVVVANKGKVVRNFGYNTINETDVKAVVEELKKATRGK
jgi:hypothetical protein